MNVDKFDFDLPASLIALRPALPRDTARMLVVNPGGALEDRLISDFPDFLRPGDVLVVNDTRVIPAQLDGTRISDDGGMAAIKMTLHKRAGSDSWRAFARPARKLKPGNLVRIGSGNGACLTDQLDARVTGVFGDGEVELKFELAGPALDQAIDMHGEVPLPPYISGKRKPDQRDRKDYQTIYAKTNGAVAAPTAGLHFTSQLMDRIDGVGAAIAPVTLHVGAGTFLPVKVENTQDHRMHAEWGEVGEIAVEAILRAKRGGGRIICTGTTSLRLLETAARGDGSIEPFCGETDIFITPGYRFKTADSLLTNFHLPRSTLFMLISAFSGLENMQRAYAHAIDAQYRFYSYGDACLLNRAASR